MHRFYVHIMTATKAPDSIVVAQLDAREHLQAGIIRKVRARQGSDAGAAHDADVAQAGQPAQRDDAPAHTCALH